MTDSIDLDDIEAESEESTETEDRNRGDWFWRGEGDPGDEPDPESDGDARARDPVDGAAPDSDLDGEEEGEGDGDGIADGDADADAYATGGGESGTDEDEGATGGAIPRVPRENEDRPVGIPVESGGAGGTDARRANERDRERTADPGTGTGTDTDTAEGDAEGADAAAPEPGTPDVGGGAEADPEAAPGGAPGSAGEGGTGTATDAGQASSEASGPPGSAGGPHGGGVDDMTQAFTYRALKRLEHLHTALSDAESWSDWVGVVGDVPAHVINKFQRENRVDVDFFNGAGSGPGERLKEIGPSSMFYAERMVLVGLEDEEWMAEAADWEFVPLSEAAEAAGWSLTDEGIEDGQDADGD